MRLKPHSPAWYDRLAGRQAGYYYPWQSSLPPFNGEDVYLELVRQHLQPDLDVLEAACGHGEAALEFAPLCRSLLAYDRVPAYIQLAEQARQKAGIENVKFVCHDSSTEANGGQPRLPGEPNSVDLVISRRGPLHWILDARRVCRRGAALIQLNPLPVPPPAWNAALPEGLRFPEEAGQMIPAVEHTLTEAGLHFHSRWTFITPEWFPEPEQFYLFRVWGEAAEDVPSFPEVQEDLKRLFARHAEAEGLAVQRGRFLWKAVIP
jgi:SAM-dependent methyltransferase